MKTFDFSLKDKDGVVHALSKCSHEIVVLFFYPKDNTPGCSIESKEFSHLYEQFLSQGIQVFGISGGDQQSKEKFCEKYNLQMPMLIDTDFSVSKEFGVYGEKSFMGKKYMGLSRETFVLDKNRKVVKHFPKVKPLGHAKEVLEWIQDNM
ncbi:MAG: peroxiredoxin [Candidatus Woesearchaeota archaeon]